LGVDPRFAKLCSSREIATQEFTGDIERLACGLQEGEVCGEDVRHALPDVQFDLRAGFRRPVRVSARIVEQDFVLADMEQDGRRARQVAIERRDAWVLGAA
jgi:hypothetical protein